MENFVALAKKNLDSLIPDSGFAVIGIDSFEMPGEGYYSPSTHETLAQAIAAARSHAAASGEKTFVLDAKGRVVEVGGG
jgi:hypothetical protein